MTPRVVRAFALAAILFAASASAQDVRGTVRDSASQVPIPGAVVITLGEDGRQFARVMSDDHGRFVVPRAAGATSVRALRIGFRPHDVAIPDAVGGSATVDIVMAVLPRMLERVVSVANPLCQRRSDADAVFGLWQQAQAGLLATVVGRESNPARSQVVVAQRERSRQRDTISEQHVRLQTGMYSNSFFASQAPADYINWGFVIQDGTGHNTFYLPDAEVLLSEPFTSAYCLSFANRDRNRPTQVGLRFTVAKPVSPRVDIDGTLWIDTAARVMREIVFTYEGLELGAERFRPGGYVRFHAMPNGLVLVNEWLTRMVSREIDTTSVVRNARRLRDLREASRGGAPGEFGEAQRPQDRPFAVTEQVGELVRAEWADGAKYHASLGAVRIHATNMGGKPMAGARIKLDSTDYFGFSDSTGTILLQDLVPGPYHVVVADSALDVIGLQVETPAWFTAARDTTLERTVAVGSAAEALAQVCGDVRYGGVYHLFAARAVNTRGQSLAGVKWSITLAQQAVGTVAMPPITGATTGDGLIVPCSRFEPGREIELRVWRETGEYREATPKVVRLTLTARATAVRVELGR